MTFKIERLFHVIHMSDDFEKLHHSYHDVFDVRKNGDILQAVTWKVVDLGRAEEYLRSKGIKTLAKDDSMLLADPNDTFGAVMRFTTRDIPGDPRAARA